MGRKKQTVSKGITYYQHVVAVTPAIRHDGPAPAYRKPPTPADRIGNLYRVAGFSGYTHPWIETGDFSRARAVARAISQTPSRPRPYICVSGPRFGSDVPVLKVCDGIAHRWTGNHDDKYLAYSDAA